MAYVPIPVYLVGGEGEARGRRGEARGGEGNATSFRTFLLARRCQLNGYVGPKWGPSESAENKREFNEEQIKKISNDSFT